MRLSSSRRRAESPYSVVYRVRVCSCVRCRPQSFIKGSTLKGQLNYSLLTGGRRGPLKRWLAWQCCYLAMRLSTPTPTPVPPSEMRAPPRFRSSSIKSATPIRLSLWSGLQQMMGFLCLCVNPFVFVVTAARCQCW